MADSGGVPGAGGRVGAGGVSLPPGATSSASLDSSWLRLRQGHGLADDAVRRGLPHAGRAHGGSRRARALRHAAGKIAYIFTSNFVCWLPSGCLWPRL